ncbi:MAG TPA: helix-turn-helix domain-containing protein, partial [Candidatus Krumholzibacteria bacterium]|nr:helix-turn-helix domain-containing protein [Candidatus Krumholzibacteria bacterium]
GNVRELQTAMQTAYRFRDASHEIHAAAVERFLESPGARRSGMTRTFEGSLREQIDRLEEQILRRALAHHAGNVTQVSKALNLSRQQLYNKFRKYGIAIREE